MIYWASQSAFIWWSFDVVGIQLNKNIYVHYMEDKLMRDLRSLSTCEHDSLYHI